VASIDATIPILIFLHRHSLHLSGHSFIVSFIHLFSQSVSLSISLSVCLSVGQSVSQSIKWQVIQSVSQSVSQSKSCQPPTSSTSSGFTICHLWDFPLKSEVHWRRHVKNIGGANPNIGGGAECGKN